MREVEIESRDRMAAESGPIVPAWLYILDGGETALEPGAGFELRRRNVIGRAAQCDIHVDDPSVSTVHAAVTFDGQRWIAEDLGSTNGTYVSGRLVAQPTPVENADIVQIGRVRLRMMC
jgi:predicted component of type VI protein secretion system